ncbi:hypothetical protein [Microbacterium sp. CPCC 204701]|uniref:hypothetical protein n=1 Tax=Microbacterium sp. CPCC 204701 TaxID=2493084 RepID=UPI000FDC2AFF|nr:hypothetical protein [Microbacterium sp. CPCC 204701]
MNRMFARASLTGIAAAVLTVSLVGAGGVLIQADPAAAAADEATSSAVTLTNKEDALNPVGAPFPDLEVTISQTKDLVSQGIRVSWTGSDKSTAPDTNQGGSNFLQIAQCWGEDPKHPGHPDRRTCQYGGLNGRGSTRDDDRSTESIAPDDMKYSADLGGYHYTGIPFVAVNSAGIVDEALAPADRVLNNLTTGPDGKPRQKPGSDWIPYYSNPFFSMYTTNEVRWAPAGADGSGSVPFEIQTAMQAPGLGCGAPIALADGGVAGQSCWLVIIPRGTMDNGENSINRPGLFWDSWEHHLAVKLDFKPLGVRCEIGMAERQLAGSELLATAIGSWQPKLCLGDNGAPFVLNIGNEASATVRAAGTEASPLAFTSRPLDPEAFGGTDPLAYAPVGISGVAISFAIDRVPKGSASDEYKARAGLPLTEMNLTPRLVAKLLTASYVESVPQLPAGVGRPPLSEDVVDQLAKNPWTLLEDKEFQAVNDPEWSVQNPVVRTAIADALVPAGRSDLAVRVWEYVMSDPAARAWLAGEPDEQGMIVNPWYSTNPAKNPTGTGLVVPSDSFPKADPITRPAGSAGEGEINLVSHRPYTIDFTDGAHLVLRGEGKIVSGWNPQATPPRFDPFPPRPFGSQAVIGLTTVPAAHTYETVTVSLRNAAGEFVAPTADGLAAGAAAMTPTPEQSKVLVYDPASDRAKAARTAYPLTMPVYAALNPQQSDASLRAAYADLIRYAAKEGQQPGTDSGQLPPGYAPLPQSWVAQALAAADAIERGSLHQPSGGGTANDPLRPPGASNPAAPPSSGAPAASSNPPAIDAPVATGAPAGDLAGSATPEDPETGPLAAAVPIGVAAGLAAGLAVPLISRIRRRP